VWRYLLGSTVEPSLADARPVFRGAAGTDEAKTLLCGSLGTDQSGNVIIDGVVVVLDREGKLVKKQVVAPPPSGEIAHLAYSRSVPDGAMDSSPLETYGATLKQDSNSAARSSITG
jgi:hypothetical protein